ncbi:MAG: hypothetical protein HQL45_14450 [Alphaproteobacteria bacterium]|nr:hypothetical protein [Alphaproteobacteria bacterium]
MSAYFNRETRQDRDGQTYRYSVINNQSDYINRTGAHEHSKGGTEEVSAGGILLPGGRDPKTLGWNSAHEVWLAVESSEDAILQHRFRRNPDRAASEIASASPAHRLIISLHNDLPRDAAKKIVERFIEEHITSKAWWLVTRFTTSRGAYTATF